MLIRKARLRFIFHLNSKKRLKPVLSSLLLIVLYMVPNKLICIRRYWNMLSNVSCHNTCIVSFPSTNKLKQDPGFFANMIFINLYQVDPEKSRSAVNDCSRLSSLEFPSWSFLNLMCFAFACVCVKKLPLHHFCIFDEFLIRIRNVTDLVLPVRPFLPSKTCKDTCLTCNMGY